MLVVRLHPSISLPQDRPEPQRLPHLKRHPKIHVRQLTKMQRQPIPHPLRQNEHRQVITRREPFLVLNLPNYMYRFQNFILPNQNPKLRYLTMRRPVYIPLPG